MARNTKAMSPDELRHYHRSALMSRCARMMRLEKLNAPSTILEDEEKLIAKVMKDIRPRDVAQAMHDFPGFVAKFERAMKEIEAENPVPEPDHVDADADRFLDPDTPIEEINDAIREAGGDPERIGADGVAFIATLICSDCEARKGYLHAGKCDGEYRCPTDDGDLRCGKWTGHPMKKSGHVMIAEGAERG